MPLEPFELFKPLSWKRVADGESVRMAEPTFLKWMGPSPGSDYGRKPIAEYDGRPAFGELVILRTCIAHGWEGVWVRHAGGKVHYNREFWPKPVPVSVPTEVQAFLDVVAESRGGTFGGTWDILLWDPSGEGTIPDSMRFIEAKWRGGTDSLKPGQIEWYRTMRSKGVAKSSFLFVEWSLAIPRLPAT